MTQAAPPRAGSPAGPVRLSIFSVQDHYPDRSRTLPQFYAETVEQCVLADKLGYDSYFVAEHHFSHYGAVPNPAVMLSHLAALTRDIRLGPAISVLTFHNPLDVAESYAMLDILSGGRVTLGVGSGYLKHEFDGYGIDPAHKRERYDEAMAVLKKALTGERFSHEARYHAAKDVQICTRPVQPHGLPMYVAVSAPEVSYHVGRQGNNMIMVPYSQLERVAQVGEVLANFRRGHEEHVAAGGDRSDGGDAMAAFHAHVAATDADARVHAEPAFQLYLQTRLRAKHQTYEKVMSGGLALFGSADTVAGKMLDLYNAGIRHFVLLKNFGNMPAEQVRRSMHLFAEEVLPRFNAALGQRKARIANTPANGRL